MYVFFKVSIHVQQTTQLKHYAACLQHGGGETTDWRQTAEKCENKRQRDAKMNWNSWQPRNRKQKNLSNFRKQTFIQVYKYIQHCLSKIYRSWKRKKKGNWNEIRMRKIKKEECWHRGLLKQKRITKAECKGKERKRKCKKRNAKEKCKNDIRTPRMNEEKYAEYRYKRKRFLAYSWIHEDQLKAMEN